MSFGGAKGTAKTDLTASFQNRDHHHVCDPNSPDKKSDRTKTKEERCEGVVGSFGGLESVSRSGNLDLVRELRIGSSCQHIGHVKYVIGLCSDKNRGWRLVVVEKCLGSNLPDQRGSIEVGMKRETVENPHHREPFAA